MAIAKAEHIWMDGALTPWDRAQVHVLSHGLHYGSSVFEGIRAYATPEGPALLGLDLHVRRLLDSCRLYRMDIPWDHAALCEAVCETLRANGQPSAYVRPIVFRGMGSFSLDPRHSPIHVVIATIEWGRYLGEEALEKGVDACVSTWQRVAPNTLPAMAKVGGQYVGSQLIAMEAADRGCAEGIALDVNGWVSEGSGENVFLVREGVVLTPPVSSGILPGVTRRFVMQLCRDLGIPVREEAVPREMLYTSDEVFFTGTAAEITPVRSVDGLPVGRGTPGAVTRRLQKDFFEIVEGRAVDRHGWLTPVARAEPIALGA